MALVTDTHTKTAFYTKSTALAAPLSPVEIEGLRACVRTPFPNSVPLCGTKLVNPGSQTVYPLRYVFRMFALAASQVLIPYFFEAY
jgi:hypothetical protein